MTIEKRVLYKMCMDKEASEDVKDAIQLTIQEMNKRIDDYMKEIISECKWCKDNKKEDYVCKDCEKILTRLKSLKGED